MNYQEEIEQKYWRRKFDEVRSDLLQNGMNENMADVLADLAIDIRKIKEILGE